MNSPGPPSSILRNDAPAPDFLSGGGETGALMRAKDWAQTPLGAPETWPQSLKTCLRIILTSRQPMFVWWGDQLVNLYNDPYKTIVGGKHPAALGQPASVVWREIWDQIAPRAETAMRRNEGTYDEALLLIMERYGYKEETYYTFSYSPVPNDQGGTGGIICANTDDTQRIISERQLALLRELASRTADARDVGRACQAAAQGMETDQRDLPFALIYLLDPDRRCLTLVGTAGIAANHKAAPDSVSLDAPHLWPLADVARTNTSRVVDNLGDRFERLPTGSWDSPPTRAVILPLAAQGEAGIAGILVVGLNPYRLYDETYQGFMGLVAGHVESGIANARAYEQERRRAEALAEIDRAKTVFFSNISHEFRTPLTLMLAPLEDALNDASAAKLSPLQHQRLDVAHRNSLRLLKLVNTLLDFSRIEAGRAQGTFQPTDLAALTIDLASGFRSAIEKAGLYLELNCPTLPQPVYVDREMWEKIVLNLLSNAFKFTFQGGITVAVRADGDHAVLSVRDTGTGIPAHELPRIFERFHRIEGQRSRSFEGSGIGLALVQELVRLHGATISAKSEPDHGAVLTVRIPFGPEHLPADRIGESSSQVTTAARIEAFLSEALHWLPDIERGSSGLASALTAPAEHPSRPRPRVLLADDNADMRDYVRRLLGARYDVTAVADGQAALDVLRRDHPDLVLSDVMMPSLDGFGLLREIRADPALRETPVILLSARAGDEARVEGLDAGADDYVVKPFSAQELLARIGANLSMAQLRRETAEALRARSAELEMVLSTVPVAVWFTYDRDARTARGNQAATRLLRMENGGNPSLSAPLSERPGHFRAFREGIELSPDQLPLQRAAHGEVVPAEEMEIRFGDGTTTVILSQALPIRDPAGTLAGAICVAMDITERKRAAQAILDKEERLRAAMVASDTGTFRWNPYTGEYLEFDENLKRLFGFKPGAPVRVTEDFIARVHPDDIPDLIPAIDACRNGADFSMEYRVVLPDGGIRWLYDRARMERDEQGRPTYLVGACTDVTKRKQAEATVIETRARFESIVSRAALGIAQTDASGRFILVNEPYCRILDRPENEIIGHTVQEFTHPDDLPRNLAAWGDMMATGAPFSIEKRYVRPDGSHVWVNKHVSVTQAVAGKPQYAIAIVQDVTARRQAEEELRALNDRLEERIAEEVDAREETQARLAHAQRMEALGQLAGGIAHDFNNVLQAVMGGLSLIERRTDAGDRIRHLARMASDAAERGKAITSRLLAFARRGELRTVVVEPRQLLEGVTEILGSTLGATITVTVDAAPDLPALLADKAQLETVLINLSVNARDAMPAGGELTLSARAVRIAKSATHADGLRAGEYVRLDVSDTGTGMDAATLARASEPFFTTKPVGQGTGLGLAMARGFAEQSQGGFAIHSVPGDGTTISLWFPRAGAPAQAEAVLPPHPQGSKRARTLVVDDDPMVRAALAEQLRALGHHVIDVSDGLAALALLDSGEKPDLLVTDFSMPGMNGLMLIDEARLRLPDVPALLLTGFADASLRDIERAGDGRTILLRKPISHDALAERITTLLGQPAADTMAQ